MKFFKDKKTDKKINEDEIKNNFLYPVYFPPHAPSGIYTEEYYKNNTNQFESGFTIVEVKDDGVVYAINDHIYQGILYIASFLAKTAKKRCNADILILALVKENLKSKSSIDDIDFEDAEVKFYKYTLSIYILDTYIPHNKHINSEIKINFNNKKDFLEGLKVFNKNLDVIQNIINFDKNSIFCITSNLPQDMQNIIKDYVKNFSNNIVEYPPLKLFFFTRPIRILKSLLFIIIFALGISYYLFSVADTQKNIIVDKKNEQMQQKIQIISTQEEKYNKILSKITENNRNLIQFILSNKNKKVYMPKGHQK